MNEKVRDLCSKIGQQAVSHMANEEWHSVEIYYASIGQFGTGSYRNVDAYGEQTRIQGPNGWIELMVDLKYAMFEAGMGAWLSTLATVTRDPLGVEFKFNFDDMPAWSVVEPRPEDHLIELDRFPRPAEQIPSWFPTQDQYPNWRDDFLP